MFLRLAVAHLVGDFVLQNHWLVMHKRNLSGLAIHICLVMLAMLMVTWSQLGKWWPWLLVISILHGVIDWAKIRLAARVRVPPIVPFTLDQLVHLLTIAAVVALADGDGTREDWRQVAPLWWVASVYLTGTFALSIALPLWLDPPSLMRRPLMPRVIVICSSALVLTLAWRGLPILIPVVGLGAYQAVARRLARKPGMATYAIEFLSALVVAASLGWALL